MFLSLAIKILDKIKIWRCAKLMDLEVLKKRLNIVRKEKEAILFEEARLIRLIKQQEKHKKKENS